MTTKYGGIKVCFAANKEAALQGTVGLMISTYASVACYDGLRLPSSDLSHICNLTVEIPTSPGEPYGSRGLYFHNKHAISTSQNLSDLLAFFGAGSMLQINGREIFQKERVDKGYQENR
jgi:hypothetical protein